MTTDFWTTLSERKMIDIDRVVAGLHNVELLEGLSPYAHRKGPYFPQVDRALRALPSDYWEAALAIFGSVIYVPEPVLSATMQYLWWAVRKRAADLSMPLSLEAEDVLIMEVDADGLVPDFARQNGLSARLNGNVHPRLNDVQRLRFALSQLHHGTEDERVHAVEQLRRAGRKRAWVLLTDKALSGQSLSGDLQKIVYARDLIAEWLGERPTIFVAAQIATSTAENAVLGWAQAEAQDVHVLSAIRLDERARVGSPDCTLFDERMHKVIVELCDWFDEEIVSKDLSLARFREYSGGSLALGYKQTGITLVDYQNAPTNSLPLLWFNASDPAARYTPGTSRPTYVGPFPRVHSRRGEEDPRWSEGVLWAELLEEGGRETMLGRLA